MRFSPTLLLLLALAAAGCTEEASFQSGSLFQPIDLAFACEGPDHTQPPQNDESAASSALTRMCPDIQRDGATVEGALFGLVLSQSPSRVHVVQMNPHSGAGIAILDADRFVPGISGVIAGAAPIQILRDRDATAFYVVNAGSKDITKIIVRSFDGLLDLHQETFPLPGTPSHAFVTEGKLWVSAAFRDELWVLNTQSLDAEPTVIALPGKIHSVAPLGELGFALTWKSRAVLSFMNPQGNIDPAREVGLVPACRDGLDNNGDGLIDHADPTCHGASDVTEGTDERAGEDMAALEPLAPGASGLYCDDGLDNDGDGLVDDEDPSCAPNGSGERVATCGDGIDNDGDGATDLDDPSCYASTDGVEAQLAGDGPFHLATVDSANAGRFVYVLDQSVGQVLVFAHTTDAFLRQDVNATPALADAITYRAYGDTAEQVLNAATAAAQPSLSWAGHQNLVLPTTNLTSIQGFHGLGELWDRAVAADADQVQAEVPEALNASTHWLPGGCDPEVSTTCRQPSGDADHHFVAGSRLDGQLQLIQSVYRGAPWHRFVQSTHDPALRTWSVSQPKLRVDGTSIAVGSTLPQGQAFLGPMSLETFQEALSGIQPSLTRFYGVWPPADPEQAVDQSWALTREGTLPDTDGHGGRVVEDTLFVAPGATFCASGVQPGDWLVVEAAPKNINEALHPTFSLEAEGVTCPMEAASLVRIQVIISAVGQASLTLDPASAQRVPLRPVLNEEPLSTIEAIACRAALDTAIADHLLPEGPLSATPTDAFSSASLPDRLTYRVRPRGEWTVVGSRSGFAHRNVFENGACAVDETVSPLHGGRLSEATLTSGAYASCPPEVDTLSTEAVGSAIEAGKRFENHGFKIDLFPACRNTDAGVEMTQTRRDVSWSFTVDGPSSPQTVQVDGVAHSARSVAFDFRRELIHLGTSGNRVTLLKVRPTSTVSISEFK